MYKCTDNSGPVLARAINMLKEMPHPYPVFSDLLRFFACIDYSRDEGELIEMVGKYLIANTKH